MDQGRSEIWIDAAPEDVFRFVGDFGLHRRWKPGLEVEPRPTGPARVGDAYRTRGRHPERRRVNEETVTRVVSNALLEFDGRDRLGVFHHGFSLEPEGGGTRVVRTAAADFRMRPLRLLRPLVYRTLVPHMLRRDLTSLKACVEMDGSHHGT